MAISQYENEYYGLSGDVKPLGTPLNGRKFTEMDTSKEYRYDAENQQWLQQSGGGGGGGSTTLAGLTDVDISNPTDGQTLVYNATSGKWENGAGGGGSASVLVVTDTGGTLDKTWNEINAARQVGIVVLNGLKNQSGYDWPKYLSVINIEAGNYFADFTSLGSGWTTSSYIADSASGTMVEDV